MQGTEGLIVFLGFLGTGLGAVVLEAECGLEGRNGVADAGYRFRVEGNIWLESGRNSAAIRSFGRLFSQGDGSLRLTGCTQTSGKDHTFGRYNGTRWLWETAVHSTRSSVERSRKFVTEARNYIDTDVATFHQEFPDDMNGTSSEARQCDPKHMPWIGCDWKGSVSSFPSFSLPSSSELAWFQFYGEHLNDAHNDTHRGPRIGRWEKGSIIPDGLLSGPMAIFDRSGRTTVLSSLNNFMDATVAFDNETEVVSLGIMGGVDYVPSGYKISFVLHADAQGGGINRAFHNWGRSLLSRYSNTRRFHNNGGGFVESHLGYETDNGAYYYYAPMEGRDMYGTLLDVKHSLDQMGVAVKWANLDSWRYFKGPGSTGGEGVPMAGGVKNWTTDPRNIPNGDEGVIALSKQTGWDFMAHNRWWQNDTDYAVQNGGGKFLFYLEKDSHAYPGNGFALPSPDSGFWSFFFSYAATMNVKLYNQDWLWTQFLGMEITTRTLGIASRWLEEMGLNARENGINIQMCMSLPRHALQSLSSPAFTQIRTSDDYGPSVRDGQWRIGRSSLLAIALGLAPYKDPFFTSNRNESHGKVMGPEPFPPLQAAVATFSNGPVAFADGVDFIDATLLNRSINADGEILRPDIGMVSIDRSYLVEAFETAPFAKRQWPVEGAQRPENMISRSVVGDPGVEYLHLLSADLEKPLKISVKELAKSLPPLHQKQKEEENDNEGCCSSNTEYLVYMRRYGNVPRVTDNSLTDRVYIVKDADATITIPSVPLPEFTLTHITRVGDGEGVRYILLGETGKWLPISKNRVVDVVPRRAGLSVHFRGVPDEHVTLQFARISAYNESISSNSGRVTFVELTCRIGSTGIALAVVQDGAEGLCRTPPTQ
mmetsp:Transcript_19238/g.31303  ORF Transcript_19238/g.31303 Transcript_19238/m.31303 type:complete len:878 (-) Transcript_19238:141-2774(-)